MKSGSSRHNPQGKSLQVLACYLGGDLKKTAVAMTKGDGEGRKTAHGTLKSRLLPWTQLQGALETKRPSEAYFPPSFPGSHWLRAGGEGGF